MTKAERIFNATRQECRKYIKTWGYEVNPNGTACGFNGLFYEENECVYMRTINAVAKILTRKRRDIEIDVELGIITTERASKESQILNMVETTLNNSRRNILAD